MRTPLCACLVAVGIVACGGAKQQAPAAAGASPSVPSSPPDAPAPPASTTPTTTTTATLSDVGDGGTKLEESPARPEGERAPKGSKPHTHDPGRSPEDIRAIVVAHRDEARACYDKALKDHPGIEGDLVIQWTIDPKGSVTAASLDTSRSTITESGVVMCVAEVIRKIQFAPSAGRFETKAHYPFNFHPRK